MGHFVEFLRSCCNSGAPNVSQTMFLDAICAACHVILETSTILRLSVGLCQKGKTFRIEIWQKWAIWWNF